jgi:hypothetical protein
MTLRLLFTLMCDDVRLEASGKLTLVGLYNCVMGFSYNQSNVPTGAAAKVAVQQLCVVLRWSEEAAGKNTSIEIIGPDGTSRARAELTLGAPTDEGYIQAVVKFLGLAFDDGKYMVRTVCGSFIFEEPFLVKIAGTP